MISLDEVERREEKLKQAHKRVYDASRDESGDSLKAVIEAENELREVYLEFTKV